MPKIKLDATLYDKANKVAQAAGYSSVDEFITHIINQEFDKLHTDQSNQTDENVVDRLRGLGYIE